MAGGKPASAMPQQPAYRLASWLFLVVAIQYLDGVLLAAAFAALALIGRDAAGRWLRLAWRTRWLLLSLLLVLGYSVAGEGCWELPGIPSPTREGVREGLTQVGRLLLVLAAVAALVASTPPAFLMAGCRSLLRPFATIGVDIDRAVVRLALVLHYAEEADHRDWRRLLTDGGNPGPAIILLPEVRATSRDCLATILSATLLVAAVTA